LRRFILNPADFAGDEVTITGELYHYMARVLRLKKGCRIRLADGAGREYAGCVSRVDGDSLSVVLEGKEICQESVMAPAITIFQGLPRGDRLDLILQKCTELGAAAIIPFAAARSTARVPAARLAEKMERWWRITREAARQSNRSSVPEISYAGDLAQTLRLADQPVKLLLWEESEPGTLRRTLAENDPPERLAVIVGPEGGLTAEEAAGAVKCGFIPVSLGRRIVRTETAGPAILAILQYHWGDMG